MGTNADTPLRRGDYLRTISGKYPYIYMGPDPEAPHLHILYNVVYDMMDAYSTDEDLLGMQRMPIPRSLAMYLYAAGRGIA